MSVSLQPDAHSFIGAQPVPPRQGGVLSPFGWMYAEAGVAQEPASVKSGAPADTEETKTVSVAAAANTSTSGTVEPASASQPAAGPVLMHSVESSPQTLLAAMDLLQAGLAEANVDPASVNLRASENLEWSPFGSYYDRQIEVRLPDGQWLKVNADLAVRYPHVAVWDIQRALGMPF